jgi:hypothetical protein
MPHMQHAKALMLLLLMLVSSAEGNDQPQHPNDQQVRAEGSAAARDQSRRWTHGIRLWA